MFDLISGLPIHPLVIHGVVVLGPLAALLAIAYAARPAWRRGLQYPPAGLAVLSAVLGFVATQSGEALEHRIGEPGFDHAEAGELAAISLAVLAGAVLLTVFVLIRRQVEKSDKGRSMAALAIVVLASLFVGFAVTSAGHTGAKSVWTGEVSGTTSTSGEGSGDED